MKGKISIAGLLFLILNLSSSWSIADDEKRIPAKPGDKVGADGPDGGRDEAVVTEDVCEILNDEGTTKRRKDYAQWIKDLICDYLKADFSSKAERTDFIEKVLSALQRHPSGTGWSLKPQETVVHIVTQDPAYLDPKDNKVMDIVAAQARRSLKMSEKAAIGIHQKYFHTPRLIKKDEALEVIPKAETAILLIFGLKKIADLVAESSAEIPAAKEGEVNEALKNFKEQLLFEATLPRFELEAPIPGKPAERRELETEPTWDEARNLVEEVPEAGAPKRNITKLKPGEPLGITTPVTGYRFSYKQEGIPPTGLESIEEKGLYDAKKASMVVVYSQTFIQIYVEVPAFTTKEGGKDVRPRIVAKDDKTDCTDTIKKHEDQHANDVWDSWKAEMIDAVYRRFDETAYEGQNRKVFVQKRVRHDKLVYVEMAVAYFFARREDATKALDGVKKQYAKVEQEKLMKAFKDASARREQALHANEQGIDDDCKSVKAGGRQFQGIKPVEEGKIRADPRLGPGDF